MSKVLKLILKITLSLVLLVVVLVFGLIFLVKPDQYKDSLEELVLSNSGLQLNIAGNIELRFSPYIGIDLNDIRIKNPDRPQELASTSRISLRVDPLALIKGQLVIEEFSADDFHVNWFTDASGSNIWDLSNPTDNSTSGSSPSNNSNQANSSTSTQSSMINTTSFKKINIANASIDIQDLSQGSNFAIDNLNFSSTDANLENRTFAMLMSLDFTDNSTSTTLPMRFSSTAKIDLAAGNVQLDDISFSLTPMLLQGRLEIADLEGDVNFNGALRSNSFDISGLLQSLGLISAESDPLALPSINSQAEQQFQIGAQFSGNANQISLDAVNASLGDLKVEASADIRLATDFAPNNINFDIKTSALNLSPYFSDTASSDANGAKPSGSAAAIPASNSGSLSDSSANTVQPMQIPKELLANMNIQGSIYIESVFAAGIQFGEVNLLTHLEDNVLDIDILPISALGGEIVSNLRLDNRASESTLQTQLIASNINIAELAPSMPLLGSITGSLTTDSNYTAQGNDVDALLASLNGGTNFSIANNSVDISVIKQVFTAIAALSPGGESIENWPDIVQFTELTGSLTLQEGLASGQQIALTMDNINLAGSGGIDLDNSAFDYQFKFTVLGPPEMQTIAINPRYHDISWPVRCAANFDAPTSQFCRPDFQQVRDLFLQMGTNEVKQQINDAIIDKVPEELQDTARSLLRGLFN